AVRLWHIRIAEPWDDSNLPFPVLRGCTVDRLRRRKSERRKRQPGFSRAFSIGAFEDFVLKHSDIGNIQPPPIRRERDRKRQPAHGNARNSATLMNIENRDPE